MLIHLKIKTFNINILLKNIFQNNNIKLNEKSNNYLHLLHISLMAGLLEDSQNLTATSIFISKKYIVTVFVEIY